MARATEERDGLAEIRRNLDRAHRSVMALAQSSAAAKRGSEIERDLARAESLISAMADTSNKSRFDDHEARISALEHKVGRS